MRRSVISGDEPRYRSLVESVSDWIWEVDTSGVYTYSSPAVMNLLGYEPEEVVGKTPFDFMLPDEAKRVAAEFEKALSANAPFERVENINMTKDGRLVVLETSGAPIIDEYGRLLGYRGVDRDITKRKKAEEELNFRNILLTTQQEASLDGILVVDVDGKILSYNRRFIEMWGIPQDVIVTKSDELALKAILDKLEEPQKFLDRVNYLYQHRTEKSSEEVHLRDGRTFDRYSAPMLGDNGKYYGRVWYFRDISERKAMERQKDNFYAMVTHDLKSPLTAILAYAEFILESHHEALDPEIRETVTAIHQSGEKMKALVNDYLSVSRLESGKLEVEPAPCSIPRMLNEVCRDLEKEIRDKKIDFRVVIAEGLTALVNIDRALAQRAVSNLLHNALIYTPPGGAITLGADRINEDGGDAVVLFVTDNGPGIPAEEHELVFEKFYRTPRTGHIKGSGLGLAIVKEVAEAHGGRVELESEPGCGSTFRIILPLN